VTDDLERARLLRERKRSAAPVGAFGPSRRRQARIAKVMDKVHQAERRNGAPTPERITVALDICGLYGPEVDEALGGVEPMVDEWETGERIPTAQQVRALARLTGFPVDFFFLPPPPPLPGGWICSEGGCEPLDTPSKDLTDTKSGVIVEGGWPPKGQR
jgi:transcriptional regulator with XRE-family HTH domain